MSVSLCFIHGIRTDIGTLSVTGAKVYFQHPPLRHLLSLGHHMNWLDFVSSLVASLAWPITLLILLYWFKNNLQSLFPFIERFKYKDFEVQFRAAVKEIAEESKVTLPAPEPEEEELPIDIRDQLFQLVEVSPRTAILEAWLHVEAWAVRRVQMLGKVPTDKLKNMAPLRLGKLLQEYKILTPNQMHMFHKLRDLRNKAVHVSDARFSIEDVIDYVDLALALARTIRASTHPAHASHRA